MATHSSILAWKIQWTEDLVGYSPWGCNESDMTKQLILGLRIEVMKEKKKRFKEELKTKQLHILIDHMIS